MKFPTRQLPTHGLTALLITGMLVLVLALLRVLSASQIPDQTIRLVDIAPEMAAPPPPPPPPPPPENPPPPQRMELPKLAPLLDPSAPAIKARLTSDIDLTMEMSDFALEITAPKKVAPPAAKPAQSYKPAPRPKPSPQRTTYSSGELDSRPRLRYAPTASFPAQLRKQGVTQGHATVEVLISASGNVSVRRVLSSSHPEFSSLARSVASRSRFTAPTKNGRPVKAIYRWPLVFRP